MENEIQPNVPSHTNWQKVLLFILLGLVVIAGSVFVVIRIGKSQTTNQQPTTEQLTNIPTQGVKFTGIITETNNGCWADGICSIKIDNKWVVAEIGGLRPPNSEPEIRGSLIGINFSQDTNKYIGKKVEVYAKQTDDNDFTIYDNENYYIKLLE